MKKHLPKTHSLLHLQRRLLKIVLAVVYHPRATLGICGAVLAGCIILALTRLSINTDQDRLLSPQAGFFKNYLDYERRFPENEALYVLVEATDKAHPPSVARWTELADRIAGQLRGLRKVVQRVDARTPLDQLGDWELLFATQQTMQDSFAEAQTELTPLAKLWGQGGKPMRQFLVALPLAGVDAQKAEFAKLMADSWTKSLKGGKAEVPDLQSLRAQDPSDLGYDYVVDQTDPTNHLLLIAAYLADDDSSLGAGAEQVDAVRKAADDAAAGYTDFHVAVTGRPALDADEMRTSDADSTRAGVVASIAIFVGLLVVLRSLWLALVAEISLAVAIGWTFGWATVSIGELNLLSLVFLITLIGIGMDYLVQILTRYRREARRYERPAAIWARVFTHVSPPICTACLGAAGAFLVSMFSGFRGAADLGVIAGGGLILCLVSGYTVLPALLVVFPPKLGRLDPEDRYPAAPRPMSPGRRLLGPAVWVAALSMILPFASRTYFNPNLLDMQAQNLESVKLVHKLQTWSAVAMSPDLALLGKVRETALTSPTVAGVDGIPTALANYDWLQAHQAELPAIAWQDPAALGEMDKPVLAYFARILAAQLDAGHFTDAADSMRQFAAALGAGDLAVLSQWQREFVAELKRLRSQFSPPPLDARKLPDQLREHYLSADGTYAIYITPKANLWQLQPLKAFVGDVEARLASVPNCPPLTGIAPEIFHSTKYVAQTFYEATGFALGLVLILVFLDLRSIPQTLLTVSVLGLGLPMLVGLMGLLNINWNLANFFGLPILIGAGHEYGVFMTHRYREAMRHPRRVWTAWDVSDRALLLCAYITTSSFAFFWALGHHEGLKSLGLVMALGTACIYLSAVLVVRPLLKWRIERAGHWSGKSGTKNGG